MDQAPVCKTRLLSDDPASEDAFGSHERVAKAIRDCIITEADGRAIGLAGHWGSGKSTVVRLLANFLGDSDYLFIFDAWAHRGDPLRRSFLESLIQSLQEVGWIKSKRWKEELEKLSGVTEEVETVSEPKVTRRGLAIIISLLYVPLGLAIFSKFISQNSQNYEFFGAFPLWVLGLGLVMLPILLFLIFVVFGRTADAGVASVFMNKTVEKTISTSRRTPEPTSIEFAQTFRALLRESLEEESRRLVIVVDNLDRVEANDALSIWATMRTFFDSTHNDNSRRSSFWLLVPFDPSSIEHLWLGRFDSEENQAQEYARSFEDKTFQVRFQVSPPILSDWREFMLSQLREAFPDHASTDDFLSVYRIFRRKGLRANRQLTPRDIKIFINRIGALHRQWQDEIPLTLQAYYLLVAHTIDPSGSKLTDSSFEDPRVLSILNEVDWRKYVAALHFNVPPDKALQVLIEKRIEEALATGSIDDLATMAEVPGFTDVWEDLLDRSHEDWAEGDSSLLTNAARAIEQLQSDYDPEVFARSWRFLRQGVERVKHWEILDEEMVDGLLLIVQSGSGPSRDSLSAKILNSLGESILITESSSG